MLRTTISWSTAEHEHSTMYLDIANIGNGRLSDYQFKLYDKDKTRPRINVLERYPRWTESAAALAARALCLAAYDAPTLPEKPGPSAAFTTFEITVDLVPGGLGLPIRLETLSLILQGADGVLQHSAAHLVPYARPYTATVGNNDPLYVATQALCRAAFESDNVPPVPAPFNPPVHAFDEKVYVRISEIPEPARSEFAKRLRSFPAPVIPSEQPGNVAHAFAWKAFVGD